jgi:transcriptional regulator with XRE-family HTH domain
MTANNAVGGTDLGRRICGQREEAGLSREETADRAGLSAGYLAYLESSEDPNPTRATIIRLAAALGTSPNALSGAGLRLPSGQRGVGDNPVLTSLTAEECHALIGPGGVGRVLFIEPGRGPVAIPVNYRVDGPDVVFRTGVGAGLAKGIRNGPVSFDVDHLDETLGVGWSVLVTGTACVITDPAERDRAAALGVEPWAGGERPVYVRLRAGQVTGRAIRVTG